MCHSSFILMEMIVFLFPGVAAYACVGPDGYWDPQGPDFSNCTSPWVTIIDQKVINHLKEDLPNQLIPSHSSGGNTSSSSKCRSSKALRRLEFCCFSLLFCCRF